MKCLELEKLELLWNSNNDLDDLKDLKSLKEIAKLKILWFPSNNTGETLKSISAGHPVSIQHPYEELAKYILGFPGMLNL